VITTTAFQVRRRSGARLAIPLDIDKMLIIS